MWLSADKTHILDLTGDLFAQKPSDPGLQGMKIHPDDEGLELRPRHRMHRPGPVVFKKSNHPVYAGAEIVPTLSNDRAQRFAARANRFFDDPEARHRYAYDLGDAFPGQTPQATDDMDQRYMHDDLESGANGEFNFVYASGQMEVSPFHSHEDLLGHTGAGADHRGPLAAGTITLSDGVAFWHATGNVSPKALQRVFKDYCVPLETKILTRRGWLPHDEVEIGDETIGYNPLTKRSEWTRISRVHHFDDLDFVRLGNDHWCAVVTPEHRWYADWYSKYTTTSGIKRVYEREGLVETKRIRHQHRLHLAFPAHLDGSLALTKTEAEVLAWLYTDGTVWRSKEYVDANIWQTKTEGIEQIERTLRSVPHTKKAKGNGFAYHIATAWLRPLLKRAGLWDRDDFVSLILNMSRDSLEAFMEAAYWAEGNLTTDFLSLSQNEGPLREALSLGIYLLGDLPGHTSNGGDNWNIGLKSPVLTGANLATTEWGSGPGWCVTTDLGTWTMLQGNQISLTGNCKQTGWTWGGLTQADGAPIDEELFMGKNSSTTYFAYTDSGELVIVGRHGALALVEDARITGSLVTTAGRTKVQILRQPAYPMSMRKFAMEDDRRLAECILDWCQDSGYTLMSYNDNVIKSIETLDEHNLADPNPTQPLDHQYPVSYEQDSETTNGGAFKCDHCDVVYPTYSEFLQHQRQEEEANPTVDGAELPADGHFPELRDADNPAPSNRYQDQYPYVAHVTASLASAFLAHTRANLHYLVSFRHGGISACAETEPRTGRIVRVAGSRPDVNALLVKVALTNKKSPAETLAGPLPFIYDIKEDSITTGQPGTKVAEIPGQFTPGGIVDGIYEPNGKCVIHTFTNMPWTANYFLKLWYANFPTLEVKSLHLRDDGGGDTRLAKADWS